MYERVKDSADSMMMAIVFEVGECTGFTVISRPFIKQTSTPSGSQPLTLRAHHLPLPQGTAFKVSAPRARDKIIYERKRVRKNPQGALLGSPAVFSMLDLTRSIV